MVCFRFVVLLCLIPLHGCWAGETVPRAWQPLCKQAISQPFKPLAAGAAGDPLLAAVRTGAGPAQFKPLLEAGELDRPRGERGYTALGTAAMLGNWPAAQMLLKAGARIDAPGRDGNTPLHWALVGGQFGMACQLLKSGATLPDPERHPTLLPLVALSESFEPAALVADYLIAHGYAVDATATGNRDTALMIAAELGNQALVTVLLKHGADVGLRNARGETAAQVARRAGFTELARTIAAR
ncbi:ankyrin repeat domain-containing protein [Chitiniphilus eburneus]|nr:ankyrin repeat domain-containing protein [Chitiniphilus eburneus]